MTDAELARRFPEIAWHTPIPVRVAGQDGQKYCCRLCIVRQGIRAKDFSTWFATPEEAETHIAAAHPVAQ